MSLFQAALFVALSWLCGAIVWEFCIGAIQDMIQTHRRLLWVCPECEENKTKITLRSNKREILDIMVRNHIESFHKEN